jgi:hypothetical protein
VTDWFRWWASKRRRRKLAVDDDELLERRIYVMHIAAVIWGIEKVDDFIIDGFEHFSKCT